MTMNELLSSVASLSYTEKFRLVQIVIQQLAMEKGAIPTPDNDFKPRDYFGIAHHTQQEIDDYLASTREGWN